MNYKKVLLYMNYKEVLRMECVLGNTYATGFTATHISYAIPRYPHPPKFFYSLRIIYIKVKKDGITTELMNITAVLISENKRSSPTMLQTQQFK